MEFTATCLREGHQPAWFGRDPWRIKLLAVRAVSWGYANPCCINAMGQISAWKPTDRFSWLNWMIPFRWFWKRSWRLFLSEFQIGLSNPALSFRCSKQWFNSNPLRHLNPLPECSDFPVEWIQQIGLNPISTSPPLLHLYFWKQRPLNGAMVGWC